MQAQSNPTKSIIFVAAMGVIFSALCSGCQPTRKNAVAKQMKSSDDQVESPQIESPPHSKTVYPWIPLFDGESMGDWQIIRFTGNDEAAVKDGQINLQAGYPLAGITFQGDATTLPTSDYEVELQAMKVDGTDFFCCLTFPVADQYCSLVLGGWGGTVSGISCINGDDASNNKTKTIRKYEKGKWYTVRVRVTDKQLNCWVDDEPIVELPLEEIELSLRSEVAHCKPLSLCSFSTSAAYRNIRFRQLPISRNHESSQ